MPVTFTTPLMNLVLPTVGPSGQVGPTYATNLNTALERVDAHDHTSGNGQPLSQAAFIITDSFDMNSFDIVELGASRYTSKVAVTAQASAVYVVGGDLYFNNSAGVPIQITAGTGINLTSLGTIGGDYSTSTASVIYTDSTKLFLFKQSPTLTANLACGPVFIYENTAASNYTKLQNPAGLGSNQTITFFNGLPLSTLPVKISSTGVLSSTQVITADIADSNVTTIKIADSNVTTAKIADSNVTTTKIADSNVTTAKIADNAVTPAKLGRNEAESLGSGTFSMTGTTYTPVTNLSVSFTTTGRRLRMWLMPSSTSFVSYWGLERAITAGDFSPRSVKIRVRQDGATTVGEHEATANFGNPEGTTQTGSSLYNVGFVLANVSPAAGTYTFSVEVAGGDSNISAFVRNCTLLVEEL